MRKLLKAEGYDEIFEIVNDGHKCWIQDWETFVYLGYRIQDVETIPFGWLRDNYPVGPTKVKRTITTIVEGEKPKDIFYPEEQPQPENPYSWVRGLLTLNPKPTAETAHKLGFNTMLPYASKVRDWDGKWIPNTRTPWSDESDVIAYSMCDEPDCRKHDPQRELERFKEMKKKTGKPVGSVMCCAIGCGYGKEAEWIKVVNQFDVIMCSTYPYNTKWGQTPLEYMERFYGEWKQNVKIPVIVILQALWDAEGFYKPSAVYQVKYWVDRGFGVIAYPWDNGNHTGVKYAQDEWREALKYKKEG